MVAMSANEELGEVCLDIELLSQPGDAEQL